MVGTMGVALSVCTLPGQATSDRLGPGKMELGLGIVRSYIAPKLFFMLFRIFKVTSYGMPLLPSACLSAWRSRCCCG